MAFTPPRLDFTTVDQARDQLNRALYQIQQALAALTQQAQPSAVAAQPIVQSTVTQIAQTVIEQGGFDLDDGFTMTGVAEPPAPAPGKGAVYVDSGELNLRVKRPDGQKSVTVVPIASPAHTYFNALDEDGVLTSDSVDSTDIGDATTIGKALITAASATAAQTAVGLPSGFDMTGVATPATPAYPKAAIYVDNTEYNLNALGPDGIVRHGIQSGTAPAHCYLNGITDDGTPQWESVDSTDIGDATTIGKQLLTAGSVAAALGDLGLTNSGTTVGRVATEVLIDRQTLSSATTYSKALSGYSRIRWRWMRTGGSATGGAFSLGGLSGTNAYVSRYLQFPSTFGDLTGASLYVDEGNVACLSGGTIDLVPGQPRGGQGFYVSSVFASNNVYYIVDTTHTVSSFGVAWTGGNVSGVIELWGTPS